MFLQLSLLLLLFYWLAQLAHCLIVQRGTSERTDGSAGYTSEFDQRLDQMMDSIVMHLSPNMRSRVRATIGSSGGASDASTLGKLDLSAIY